MCQGLFRELDSFDLTQKLIDIRDSVLIAQMRKWSSKTSNGPPYPVEAVSV